MTVTSLGVRNEYTAISGQTVFNYSFLIFSASDLDVYITASGATANDATDITTSYTVDTGTIGNPAGGFITLTSGAASGALVTIVSSITEDRTTDYQNSGDFQSDTVNDDFDKSYSLIKQQLDSTGRTLAFQRSLQNASELTLPAPAAAQYLAWNGAEDGLVNVGAPGVILPSELNGTTAQMVADATLIAGEFIITSGYNTNGDGGGNFFLSRAVTGATADPGALIKGVGNVAIEFVGLFPGGVANANQWGARGNGSTDDSTAIQAAFDYLSNTGIKLIFANTTYRVDVGLTLISDGSPANNHVIDFGGATLDFSSSGLTTGDMLKVGSTITSQIYDKELIWISNLVIIGPEGGLNPAPTAPDGTTVGLHLDNCGNARFDNINIRRCFKGIHTTFVFPLKCTAIRVRECYIPYHIDDDSTLAQWDSCEAVDSRFSILVQPGTVTKTPSNQTFINFRTEGCDVGPVIDPQNGSGVGANSITFYKPYFENITYDHFRYGIAWDLATPQTRGADRNRAIYNCDVVGGLWSKGLQWTATTATKAPMVFPTAVDLVFGGNYEIPCFITDFINRPTKFQFRSLQDTNIGGSGNLQTIDSSIGSCVIVGSTGLFEQSKGNVKITAAVSTGIFDITFHERYSGINAIGIGATCDGGVVEVNTATSASDGSVVRINCYNRADPPVLFDPNRIRLTFQGEIA